MAPRNFLGGALRGATGAINERDFSNLLQHRTTAKGDKEMPSERFRRGQKGRMKGKEKAGDREDRYSDYWDDVENEGRPNILRRMFSGSAKTKKRNEGKRDSSGRLLSGGDNPNVEGRREEVDRRVREALDAADESDLRMEAEEEIKSKKEELGVLPSIETDGRVSALEKEDAIRREEFRKEAGEEAKGLNKRANVYNEMSERINLEPGGEEQQAYDRDETFPDAARITKKDSSDIDPRIAPTGGASGLVPRSFTARGNRSTSGSDIDSGSSPGGSRIAPTGGAGGLVPPLSTNNTPSAPPVTRGNLFAPGANMGIDSAPPPPPAGDAISQAFVGPMQQARGAEQLVAKSRAPYPPPLGLKDMGSTRQSAAPDATASAAPMQNQAKIPKLSPDILAALPPGVSQSGQSQIAELIAALTRQGL